ncbi:MAG: zinc-ribbon domain-containing protein, partial [Clostridia bacterium]|nr:zinc-ribbon domain-containing protein [Clostridia bacterium]
MYCSHCGKKVGEDMLFCPFCGKPIVIPEQDDAPVAAPVDADPAPVVEGAAVSDAVHREAAAVD